MIKKKHVNLNVSCKRIFLWRSNWLNSINCNWDNLTTKQTVVSVWYSNYKRKTKIDQEWILLENLPL